MAKDNQEENEEKPKKGRVGTDPIVILD